MDAFKSYSCFVWEADPGIQLQIIDTFLSKIKMFIDSGRIVLEWAGRIILGCWAPPCGGTIGGSTTTLALVAQLPAVL